MPNEYDDDVYELAKGKLPDDTPVTQVQELASIIQDAIEDYLGGLQG